MLDSARSPIAGLQVQVFSKGGALGSDHLLAESSTDASGRFHVDLSAPTGKSWLGPLGRTGEVYLVLLDAQGKKVLTTRAHPLDWQLEFRVFHGGGTPVPNAPDIYTDGMRRMVAMTRGSGMGSEVTKSMEMPAGGPKGGPWRQATGMAQGSSQMGDMANMMFGIVDGVLTDSVESTPFKVIGYDGAQVPKNAWEAPDDQVIIWPRKEPFKWA